MSLTSDQKLDVILSELASVKVMQQNIEKLVNRVSTLETLVTSQAATISAYEGTIKNLVSEVKFLKDRSIA